MGFLHQRLPRKMTYSEPEIEVSTRFEVFGQSKHRRRHFGRLVELESQHHQWNAALDFARPRRRHHAVDLRIDDQTRAALIRAAPQDLTARLVEKSAEADLSHEDSFHVRRSYHFKTFH